MPMSDMPLGDVSVADADGSILAPPLQERCNLIKTHARYVMSYYSKLIGSGDDEIDLQEAWRHWNSLSGEHVSIHIISP